MENTKTEKKEITNAHAFRVSKETKDLADEIRQKIKKKFGKSLTYDFLLGKILERADPKMIDDIALSALTWVEEEKRLREMYLKKNRQVTPEKYERMKCSGQLVDFFKEHSRIKL